jgi:ATP-dependent Clp protease ATP-binding subunit ClpB
MMEALSGVENLSEVDGEEEEGKTATFPFLSKLFSGTDGPGPGSPPSENPRPNRETKEREQSGNGKKRKFLESYCISLTQKAHEGSWTGSSAGRRRRSA